jgi:hypothetical protein
MSDIFDIVQFKKSKKDKTYAVKLGWATKRDDGGFWLNLDAAPLGDGACAVVPQRERGEKPAAQNAAADDEIPW